MGTSLWRRWGSVVAVAAVVSLTCAGTAVAAPAPPPVAAGSTAGARWDVTSEGAQDWTVRLHLNAPVATRAAQPQLAVDGRVLGVARQSEDGLTLSIRTGDARVAGARSVQLAWNGLVSGTESRLLKHAPLSAVAPAPTATGPQLAQDPATGGKYAVQRADYDLGDTAVRLPGLNGQAGELRAAVYLPKGAPGARPVVVFLHGRHEACFGEPQDEDGGSGWPCAPGTKPVPSYLGYGQAAEALASAGYAVVSISADAVNALDYQTLDGGGQARGELVMAHLDLLQQWTSGRSTRGPGATLKGRLDLTDVGLMGHSRGGEGVVAAALLNDERPNPYGIRAVMPLAPTDFARATLPGVAMAVVLPYCDGDVSDQQGQHYYDDTRYAAKDDVLRSSLLVMGANHNFFNSEWTPGTSVAPSSDDWYDDSDPVCGSTAPSRLTPAEQRATGAAYVSGFFRLHLGGEQQFLPLFDGTGGRAPSAGRAVVLTQAQQPSSARTDLAPLTAPGPAVAATGGAFFCAGLGAGKAAPGRLRPCAGDVRPASDFPHWVPAYFAPTVPTTSMLRLRWTAADKARQSVTVTPTSLGTGVKAALTLRAASPGGIAPSRLDVTVADTAGRKATVDVARYSDALTSLPTLQQGTAKVVLRTVRIPLDAFTGVDLSRLKTVTFTPGSPRGDVYLSDVALDSPAAGTGGPTDLPAVSVGDVTVYETNGDQQVAVPLVLSKPSTVPVTVNLDTGVDAYDDRLRAMWVPVTIPAGATTATARITVHGNTVVDPPTTQHVTLSAPVGAILGDSWGSVQLVDDDL